VTWLAAVTGDRMLEQDAESWLQLPAVDHIVQYASVACTMLHKDAQASALHLLTALTDVADADQVSWHLLTIHSVKM